jgi:hypothetical protein
MTNTQVERYPNLARTVLKWRSTLRSVAAGGSRIIVRVDAVADDAKPRHYALCDASAPNQIIIYLSPRLENMIAPKREGVVLHEFGHVLCFLEGKEKHTEREADFRAEEVFNINIYYDPKDLVQTTSGGIRPRPSHLK